jgi:hypothetical protein
MPGSNWTHATSLATSDTRDTEGDDELEPEEYVCAPEIDVCLGPDDPGVGPWVFEFYD